MDAADGRCEEGFRSLDCRTGAEDKTPFNSITDFILPKASFCDGKVLLAGDTFAKLRQMSGLGTNQPTKSAIALV
jgi:hypothetical protein